MRPRGATLLRHSDPEYQIPDYRDLAAIKSHSRKTGAELAALAGVDDRTVRRWLSGDRQIPYAAWRLMLIELGLITFDPLDRAR